MKKALPDLILLKEKKIIDFFKDKPDNFIHDAGDGIMYKLKRHEEGHRYLLKEK